MNEASTSGADEDEGLGPMWGIVLIGCFVVLGTLFVTWRAIDKGLLAAASERFETVTGEVTLAGIRERGGTDYRAAVVMVSYVVDGEQYELKVSGKEGLSKREPDPETFVLAHPVGEQLPVYYDPESPGRAALIQEIDWARDGVLAASGLLVSSFFVLWGLRRRKASQAGTPARDAG